MQIGTTLLVGVGISTFMLIAYADDSTFIKPNNNQAMVYQCQGPVSASQPAETTMWWLCATGTSNNNNVTEQCPAGYVATGMVTWRIGSWPFYTYRCYMQCQQVINTSQNCRWAVVPPES